MYAAKDGTTADDGVGRQHSPFTEALLKHIAAPGVEVRFVLGRLRDEVVAITKAEQTPHIYGTLGGKEHYLLPLGGAIAVSPPVGAPASETERAWQAVKGSSGIDALEAFRARFSGSFYAELAGIRIEELRKAQEAKTAVTPPIPVRPDPAPETAFGTPDVVFAAGIWKMVRTSRYESGGEFHLWTDNGNTAVEVVFNSVGWWRLRRQATEMFVEIDGRTSKSKFYGYPWLEGAAKMPPPIGTARYTVKGEWGTTHIVVANDEIRITLTDSNEIRLDARSSRITLKTYSGKTLEF